MVEFFSSHLQRDVGVKAVGQNQLMDCPHKDTSTNTCGVKYAFLKQPERIGMGFCTSVHPYSSVNRLLSIMPHFNICITCMGCFLVHRVLLNISLWHRWGFSCKNRVDTYLKE